MGDEVSFRNTWPVSIVRTVILGWLFVVGCLSIVYTQVLGIEILQRKLEQRQSIITLTKLHFLTLLTFITSWIKSSEISVTYDKSSLSATDSFRADSSRNLISLLTPNAVFIGNHQLYTDWFFLWFLSYTSSMAGNVFIILKDLSKIPVLGYGMKNFNFLFLSRKWEKDKIVLTNQLLTIDADARGLGPANGVEHVLSVNLSPQYSNIKHWPEGSQSNKIWPYHIILYPEGTVVSNKTRGRSLKFSQDRNLPQLKHVLWPRVRGLLLTLKKLRNTTEIVYDITTNYSDLRAGDCGEDIFSLKRHFIRGFGPRAVNMYIRGYHINEIPLGEDVEDIDDVKEEDLKKFEEWLFKVWEEKDTLMDTFYRTGKFIEDDDPKSKDHKNVVADIKLKNSYEIILPFMTVISTILLLRVVWIIIARVFL